MQQLAGISEAEAVLAARTVRYTRIQRSAARLATLQRLAHPTLADHREAQLLAYDIEECQAELAEMAQERRQRARSRHGAPVLKAGAPRMLRRLRDGLYVALEARGS